VVGEHTSFLFVPQLILQPLIENAIVHGIACCREGGWLEIGSRKSGRWLELYVQNSVRGHSDPGTGLGLANTKARLEHLYGGEGSLQFSVRGDSAEAVVRIPAFLSSFAPRREPLALSDLPAGGP
jgi:LytS/YehU family sensor histidine kinase